MYLILILELDSCFHDSLDQPFGSHSESHSGNRFLVSEHLTELVISSSSAECILSPSGSIHEFPDGVAIIIESSHQCAVFFVRDLEDVEILLDARVEGSGFFLQVIGDLRDMLEKGFSIGILRIKDPERIRVEPEKISLIE